MGRLSVRGHSIDYPATLASQCIALGLPAPALEYRLGALLAGGPGKGLRARLLAAGLQDWRYDLAWPASLLLVEVDGGGWVAGRHSRGAGMEQDCRKLSEAVSRGWRVLRVTPAQVRMGMAVRWVERAMGA